MPFLAGPNPKPHYLQWYQQHRTLVWGTAAAAVALCVAYKASTKVTTEGQGCTRPQQQKRSLLSKIWSTVAQCSTAASTLAEAAALISGDLRSFLTSDTAELPQSLLQLNKLLQAPELQETFSTITASVLRGATSAWQTQQSEPPLVNIVLEALLSERGRGLVGTAVGVATRNATVAICEFLERRLEATSVPGSPGEGGVKALLDMLLTEQGEQLLTLLLTKGVRTAVTSYVDATSGYNLYDDMLASISKQDHRDALTDILTRISASFCRELVVSYRRNSAPATSGHMTGYNVTANVGNHIATKRSAAASATSTPSGSANGAMTGVAATYAEDSLATDAAHAGPSALPSGKMNVHISSGQNVRHVSSSLQLHKQHSVSGCSSVSSSGVNTLCGSHGRMLGGQGQMPSPWLWQLLALVRERDVRSLAVDVVKNASREATRGAVEGLLLGSGAIRSHLGDGCENGVGGGLVMAPTAMCYKLYVLATLAVSLGMFALSPRVMLL